MILDMNSPTVWVALGLLAIGLVVFVRSQLGGGLPGISGVVGTLKGLGDSEADAMIRSRVGDHRARKFLGELREALDEGPPAPARKAAPRKATPKAAPKKKP